MKKIQSRTVRIRDLALSIFALLFVIYAALFMSRAWFALNSTAEAGGIGFTAVGEEGGFTIKRWDEDGYTLRTEGDTAEAGKTYYELIGGVYTALDPQLSVGAPVVGYFTKGQWLSGAQWLSKFGTTTTDLSRSVPNETIRYKLVAKKGTLSSFNMALGEVYTVANTDAGVDPADVSQNDVLDYIYAAVVSEDTAYTTLTSDGSAITNSAIPFSVNAGGVITVSAGSPSYEIIFDIYIHRDVSNQFSLWSFNIEFASAS